jgi:hypothetical protein
MELIVQILSFGSAWWVRPGWEERDPLRYTQHAAYFNSTGVRQGSKVHMDGPVKGLVRFNATSGLNPHRTQDNIGAVFCCSGIEMYRNTNRLLAIRRLSQDTAPTHFLASMSSSIHGAIRLGDHWREGDVQAISMSRYRGRQETLLLLPDEARIRTSTGAWRVVRKGKGPPRLVLLDEPEITTGETEDVCDIEKVR